MKASEEVEDYLWQKARQEEEGNLKICGRKQYKMMDVDLGIRRN